jgi:hypothetical protein
MSKPIAPAQKLHLLHQGSFGKKDINSHSIPRGEELAKMWFIVEKQHHIRSCGKIPRFTPSSTEAQLLVDTNIAVIVRDVH